jgi:hypothetical protein
MKRYIALALPDYEVRLWDEKGTFQRPFARVALVGPELPTGPKQHAEIVQPMTIHAYPHEQDTIEKAITEAEGVEQLLYDAFRVGVSYDDPLTEPRGLVAFPHRPGGTLGPGSYTYVVTAANAGGESVASDDVVAVVSAGPVDGRVVLGWWRVPGATEYRVYRGLNVAGARLIGTTTNVEFEDVGIPLGVPAPPATGTGTARVSGAPNRVPLYDYDGIADESGSIYRDPSDFISLVDLSINALHDPVDERLIHVIADTRIGWRRRGRVASGTKLVDSVRVTDFVGS